MSSLRIGAVGQNVSSAQEAINAYIQEKHLKIATLDVDSKFGSKTKKALVAIQRYFNRHTTRDIRVDGILGDKTRGVLNLSGDATPGTPIAGITKPKRKGVVTGKSQPDASATPTVLGGNIAADRAAIRRLNHTRVNTLVNGPHITPYKPAAYRYGTARTAEFVKRLAARYFAMTGQNLRLGDISALGGGGVPDHKAHKAGRNVDVDMAFTDGRRRAEPNRDSKNATWQSPAYDRATTRKLVKLIKQLYPGAEILFNDPVLVREGLVRHFANHDNHLHIQHLG